MDYNSVFQDYALDVSEQVAVYSVVNTLIAATDVDKVEISIEGNKEVTFGQNMQLYKFYEWNDSLLAHTKAKKNRKIKHFKISENGRTFMAKRPMCLLCFLMVLSLGALELMGIPLIRGIPFR